MDGQVDNVAEHVRTVKIKKRREEENQKMKPFIHL